MLINDDKWNSICNIFNIISNRKIKRIYRQNYLSIIKYKQKFWYKNNGVIKLNQNKDDLIRSSAVEYLTYIAATGESSIDVIYQDENIWLSQKLLAKLYDVTIPTINEHLQTIFNDLELEENAVIRNFRITASDDKKYNTKHYSLECIIAVGNKVNSERAIQFRKWSNKIIKDFTIQCRLIIIKLLVYYFCP